MQQIQTMMTDMKNCIFQKISHPFLLQYIQTPYIDEDKLLLIISMLEQQGFSKLEMKDFVVTTMLIQIALDTHERVSITSFSNENAQVQKTRQLTVLAGDYYSGLYYKILANTNNLPLIRVLSEGIKEINEHKIFFYQKESESIEMLMNHIMIIESALIKQLAEYLHDEVWRGISTHVLFIKRLLHEKMVFIQEGTSLLFEGLRKIVFPKNNLQIELSAEQKKYLLIICDKYIDYSRKITEEYLRKLPSVNENIKNKWSYLIQQQNPIVKTYVEEG